MEHIPTGVYAHTPLEVDEIRLVRLLYDGIADKISCELSVTRLHNGLPYTAVSYVWGNDSSCRSILVNGIPMQIRGNLWQMLDQLRQESRSTHFWIDAVSIDQNSVDERNHQVAMMGEVYSHAENVLVWLGAKSEVPAQNRMFKAISSIEFDFQLDHYFLNTSHSKQYACIKSLSEKQYWSRAWIVQEFILAKQLELKCGPDSLKEEIFTRLCMSARSTQAQIHTSMEIIVRLRDEWRNHPRVTWQKHGLFSSLGMPEPPPNTQCLDPRDRIYSLLSLADPKELETYPIYPDYSKPVLSLLAELVDRDRQKNLRGVTPHDRSFSKLQKIKGLRDRAFELALLLEVENPEEVSSRAVQNALANTRH